jgi:hypothetical protein
MLLTNLFNIEPQRFSSFAPPYATSFHQFELIASAIMCPSSHLPPYLSLIIHLITQSAPSGSKSCLWSLDIDVEPAVERERR